MRRYLVALLALAAIVSLTFYWLEIEPNDERTQLVFHQSHGAITDGSKLGVTIGQTWREADAGLRQRFKPGSVLCYENIGQSGTRFLLFPLARGVSFVSYRDDSWRNGVVSLEFHDGRVARISWNFSPFYIDL